MLVDEVVLEVETLRVMGDGLFTRDDEYGDGIDVERGIPVDLGGVDVIGWKPARFNNTDCPACLDALRFFGVTSLSNSSKLSELRSSSDSCRSAGGGVLKRSSLELRRTGAEDGDDIDSRDDELA